MKDVIASVSDNGVFFERGCEYGPEMLTGFISLNSMVVGIVANNPAEDGGKITAKAAKKAAKHIAFCDNFDIPILTLVDTEGYDVSTKSERAPYSDYLAELAYGYSVSDNAKVSVVIGKAYGAAFTLMSSKSLGADIAFALDNAKISVMPTDSAVAFVCDAKVTDEEKAKWDATMASPVLAARNGDIDDIISSDELRMRVAAAFEMLSDKA
jgi:acetyl-CoA carboxylase carboxyltransferase component